jgi:hypothetical protein
MKLRRHVANEHQELDDELADVRPETPISNQLEDVIDASDDILGAADDTFDVSEDALVVSDDTLDMSGDLLRILKK